MAKSLFINQYGEESVNTLGSNFDANGHKITNLADPTSAQEAATKAYVDANAGGGSSETVIQINLPFADQTQATGALKRANSQIVKAKLIKNGSIVTMVLDHFNLDNSHGQFEVGVATWADFDPVLHPEEFPIPVGWRPNVTTFIKTQLVNSAIGFVESQIYVGAEGYVEMDAGYVISSGALVQATDGFTTTGNVTDNGYQITMSWVVGPAATFA